MADRRPGRVRIRAVMVSIAMVAVACTGSGEDRSSAPTAPVKGGTIVAIGPLDVSGFNVKTPKSSTIAGSVVMSMVWPSVWRVTPDSRFALNADLMVSAELTGTDPQTAVYRINPKAVWSDGVPIDAEDFIYAWQMSRPGAVDVDGSTIQAAGQDPITSVTGSDGGKTVTVVFREKYRPWQASFALLVPAHIGRRVGWNTGFDRFDPDVVISGGPFRIASHNPGSDLTLVPNEHYWAERPMLDRIILRYIGLQGAADAVRNGEADLVHAFGPNSDLVAELEALPGMARSLTPGPSQEYVGFNQRNELLAMAEVRKALALALDRRTIVDRALGRGATVGVVNSHLFTDRHPSYRDLSGGRYDRPDVAGARRMLEAAGFARGSDGVYARDGKRLSFRLRTDSDNPTRVVAEQLVQAQAKEAGIELRIDNAPLNVLLPQLQRGDFDVEILQYPKNQFGSVQTFRTGNRWGLSNRRVDDLVTRATAELDDSRWQTIVDELDALLWEEMPFLPLYQVPRYFSVRDTFTNISDNPNTTIGPFWDVQRWAVKAQR